MINLRAINTLVLALRTVGQTGTLNASGDIALCLGGEAPQSQVSRGKRGSSRSDSGNHRGFSPERMSKVNAVFRAH